MKLAKHGRGKKQKSRWGEKGGDAFQSGEMRFVAAAAPEDGRLRRVHVVGGPLLLQKGLQPRHVGL